MRISIRFAPVVGWMALGVLGMVQSASAQAQTDKACIFSSAEQLPKIPGLLITASSAKSLDLTQAATRFARNVGSSEGAIRLADKFGGLSYAAEQDLRNTYETARREAIFAKEVAKLMIAASEVAFEIEAAGQKATIGATCAISPLGAVISVSQGVLR